MPSGPTQAGARAPDQPPFARTGRRLPQPQPRRGRRTGRTGRRRPPVRTRGRARQRAVQVLTAITCLAPALLHVHYRPSGENVFIAPDMPVWAQLDAVIFRDADPAVRDRLMGIAERTVPGELVMSRGPRHGLALTALAWIGDERVQAAFAAGQLGGDPLLGCPPCGLGPDSRRWAPGPCAARLALLEGTGPPEAPAPVRALYPFGSLRPSCGSELTVVLNLDLADPELLVLRAGRRAAPGRHLPGVRPLRGDAVRGRPPRQRAFVRADRSAPRGQSGTTRRSVRWCWASPSRHRSLRHSGNEFRDRRSGAIRTGSRTPRPPPRRFCRSAFPLPRSGERRHGRNDLRLPRPPVRARRLPVPTNVGRGRTPLPRAASGGAQARGASAHSTPLGPTVAAWDVPGSRSRRSPGFNSRSPSVLVWNTIDPERHVAVLGAAPPGSVFTRPRCPTAADRGRRPAWPPRSAAVRLAVRAPFHRRCDGPQGREAPTHLARLRVRRRLTRWGGDRRPRH